MHTCESQYKSQNNIVHLMYCYKWFRVQTQKAIDYYKNSASDEIQIIIFLRKINRLAFGRNGKHL